MDTTLEALLNSGRTPEDIYKMAKEINSAKKTAEQEKKKKEITRARGDMLKGIDLWLYALIGEHMSEECMEDLIGYFMNFEKIAGKMIEPSCDCAGTCKENKSEKEKECAGMGCRKDTPEFKNLEDWRKWYNIFKY